jgi:zinc transporter ZupT
MMTRVEIWLKGLLAAAISGGSRLINAVIGVAAYLQKSPLPTE